MGLGAIRHRFSRLTWLCAATVCFCPPAHAQNLPDLSAQVAELRRDLAAQGNQIADQAKIIQQQQQEIDRLQGRAAEADPPASPSPSPSDNPNPAPAPQIPAVASVSTLPKSPVGGSPELPKVEQQASAVPEGAAVLTRAGHVVFEPSLEFTNSSSNLLVYDGVELIPGIQVGQLEASNADHDTLIAAATARYGLTRNAEIEVRVPFVYRSDVIDGIQQGQTSVVQQSNLHTGALGDIEIGLRYQLNHPVGERPIFIASLRAKSDTGTSPYDVAFDQSGVAQGLATGSGFWAVQPGLTFLLPSDPVVIFGGGSFLYQIPKTINRTAGGVLIGRVDPGNGISGNLGFAFALNRRFSFSLGYEHTYFFPAKSEIGGSLVSGDRLQVGSLLMGMSYRVTEKQTLNFGVEVGVTKDAPDVSLTLRAPFSPN